MLADLQRKDQMVRCSWLRPGFFFPSILHAPFGERILVSFPLPHWTRPSPTYEVYEPSKRRQSAIPSQKNESRSYKLNEVRYHRLKPSKNKLFKTLGIEPELQLSMATKATEYQTVAANKFFRSDSLR